MAYIDFRGMHAAILGVLSTITTAIDTSLSWLARGLSYLLNEVVWQPSTDEALRLDHAARDLATDDPRSRVLRQQADAFTSRAASHRDWLGDHFDADWGALRPA